MTEKQPPTPDEIAAIRAWRTGLHGDRISLNGALRHIDTLLAAVDQQAKERASILEENERFRRENLEAHAILTGKGEMAWAMAHPDGELHTELGKAAAAKDATVQQQAATIRTLREALTALAGEWGTEAASLCPLASFEPKTPGEWRRMGRSDELIRCSDELRAALAASADAPQEPL